MFPSAMRVSSGTSGMVTTVPPVDPFLRKRLSTVGDATLPGLPACTLLFGAGDVVGMFCPCGVLRSKLASRGEARNYQAYFSGVRVSSLSKEKQRKSTRR